MAGDVMATLAELDARLAALQREMRTVEGPLADPAAPTAPAPQPAGPSAAPLAHALPSSPGPTADPVVPAAGTPEAPPPPPPPALAPSSVITGQQLDLWRERLRRGLSELAALQAELTGLQAEIDAAAAQLATVVHPAPPVVSPAPALPPYAPASAPMPSPAPHSTVSAGARPVPTPHDRLFEGRVTVDAGPFLDIDDVTVFQRAIEQVPGSLDVYVTGFDLNRAHFEIDLVEPVALGREIRSVLPFNFAIFEAGHGRLAINVDARPAASATSH